MSKYVGRRGQNFGWLQKHAVSVIFFLKISKYKNTKNVNERKKRYSIKRYYEKVWKLFYMKFLIDIYDEQQKLSKSNLALRFYEVKTYMIQLRFACKFKKLQVKLYETVEIKVKHSALTRAFCHLDILSFKKRTINLSI